MNDCENVLNMVDMLPPCLLKNCMPLFRSPGEPQRQARLHFFFPSCSSWRCFLDPARLRMCEIGPFIGPMRPPWILHFHQQTLNWLAPRQWETGPKSPSSIPASKQLRHPKGFDREHDLNGGQMWRIVAPRIFEHCSLGRENSMACHVETSQCAMQLPCSCPPYSSFFDPRSTFTFTIIHLVPGIQNLKGRKGGVISSILLPGTPHESWYPPVITHGNGQGITPAS